MKRTLKILSLISLWCYLSYGDEVYLRNGQILRNCHVADTTESKVRIETSTGIRTFPLVVIDKIVKSSYDPQKPTFVQNEDGSLQTLDSTKVVSHEDSQALTIVSPLPIETASTTYPNLYLLPVSFVSFGLAWDYLQTASEIQDSPDNSIKNRKTVLGVVFLAAGVINTVFALKTVEVKASSNSLGLVYHF